MFSTRIRSLMLLLARCCEPAVSFDAMRRSLNGLYLGTVNRSRIGDGHGDEEARKKAGGVHVEQLKSVSEVGSLGLWSGSVV
jgi:hypothetical protein